jgi:endonuclease IV
MFGAHLSTAGGLHQALLAAERWGMDTVQIFTASPRRWASQPQPKPSKLIRTTPGNYIVSKSVHFVSEKVLTNTFPLTQWKT